MWLSLVFEMSAPPDSNSPRTKAYCAVSRFDEDLVARRVW